ncbi:MAG: tetratricopeptide repeat protein, partial [Chloroflexota bacterium]
AEMKTTEELFLTGSRILQFYNPNLNAMDYFEEALKRDPGDIRTNTEVGKIHLKNGEYEIARKYFTTAINRLTKDYTRPSNCEPLYLQGLTLKALGLYDEAIDTLYRATWDQAWHSAAYIELARIYCLRGETAKALSQVNESLSTNSGNNAAINLKATLLRSLGDVQGARAVLTAVLQNDPLDFRAINENYLALRLTSPDKASGELASLNRKMRNFARNYLDLATGYMNDGFYGEAEDVLKRFTGTDQELTYYLGFLADKKGNEDAARKFFKAASSQSVDYGFPYRFESVKVLEKASQYFPEDSRPYYYLGNLYYDRQPGKAIECWEKAVKYEPSLAIAWRNLGWGYYQHSQDLTKAIAAYEKAMENKKDDPVYYAELDPLYEMANTPIEKRAKLFEGTNDIVKQRDDAFVREIIVLNLSDQFGKAVEYLDQSNFHFREGSSRVRDITVDAHLLLGRKFMAEKKYKEALDQFLGLAATPENSDLGRRGDFRSPQINYFTGLSYEALGQKARAKQYFTMSAGEQSRQISNIKYYQGLAMLKLGNKTGANEIFNSLVNEADNRIKQGEEVDFFAKFGEREAENVRLSNAYLLKGLGYKGLGDKEKAVENLRKAMELSASNLYAKVEME